MVVGGYDGDRFAACAPTLLLLLLWELRCELHKSVHLCERTPPRLTVDQNVHGVAVDEGADAINRQREHDAGTDERTNDRAALKPTEIRHSSWTEKGSEVPISTAEANRITAMISHS